MTLTAGNNKRSTDSAAVFEVSIVFLKKGFSDKAICSFTMRTWVSIRRFGSVQTWKHHQVRRNLSGMSVETRRDTTVLLLNVNMPAAVNAFKHTETKPDNWRKPTVSRSEEAADRWSTGVCYQEDREGSGVPGQSGCDRGRSRPAVIRHIRPIAHSWTSMCVCWVPRSAAQQDFCIADYHLLPVCITPLSDSPSLENH